MWTFILEIKFIYQPHQLHSGSEWYYRNHLYSILICYHPSSVLSKHVFQGCLLSRVIPCESLSILSEDLLLLLHSQVCWICHSFSVSLTLIYQYLSAPILYWALESKQWRISFGINNKTDCQHLYYILHWYKYIITMDFRLELYQLRLIIKHYIHSYCTLLFMIKILSFEFSMSIFTHLKIKQFKLELELNMILYHQNHNIYYKRDSSLDSPLPILFF